MADAIAPSPPTEEALVSTDMQTWIDFLGIQDKTTSAMNNATFFNCIKILSETIGKLPLKIMQKSNDNGTRIASEHYLSKVLGLRPNRHMAASVFWSFVEYQRNYYGNSYVYISGAGNKLELIPLDSSCMKIYYDDANIIGKVKNRLWYVYSQGSKRYKFMDEEILHFKTAVSKDGITGLAVKDQIFNTLEGTSEAQKMLNKNFKSSFTAKAVLQYTSELNDEKEKKLLKKIERFATGQEDTKSLIPLPLGFQLQPIASNLADNQFLEIKQNLTLEIATAFGIKPNQINDYTKSSFASSEAQQLSFYVDTLLFILKQYEEEISYKLLSDEELIKGYKPKFNINVILRADSKTQMEYLKAGVSGFILKPDEAREQLDLSKVDGGDKLLGNGSTISLDLVGTQYIKGNQTGDNEKVEGKGV